MFDLSWAEMGVILVVATVAIGPKDLPVVLRKAGRGWAHMRKFGNDLRRQFDESPLGAELRAAQAEVERESRLITGNDGKMYETFSLDDITDTSRATPISVPPPLIMEDTPPSLVIPAKAGTHELSSAEPSRDASSKIVDHPRGRLGLRGDDEG